LGDGRTPSPRWKRHALFAGAVGVLFFASFIVEVFAEAPRIAGAIRFVAATVFLAMEIPAHHSNGPAGTMTRSFRWALILILLGLFFPVLWPWQRVAGLHLIFIGGYTLITFTVATRVALGHSGHGHLFSTPLLFLRGAAVLLVAAAIFRAVGDFFPIHRGLLLDLAGYLWMLAAAVWGWRVLPNVRIAEPETL